MPPLHGPVTCTLLARLEGQILQFINFKSAATRLLAVIKTRNIFSNSSACLYSIIYEDYFKVICAFELEMSLPHRFISIISNC